MTEKNILSDKKIIERYGRNMLFRDKLNKKVTISDLTRNHAIYLYNCVNCVFIIKNKISNLVLENCINCIIRFQTIITKIDLLRCHNIELFCKYNANMIQSDFVSCLDLYVNKNKILPNLYFSNIECFDVHLNIKDSDKRYLIHNNNSSSSENYLFNVNENSGLVQKHLNGFHYKLCN